MYDLDGYAKGCRKVREDFEKAKEMKTSKEIRDL